MCEGSLNQPGDDWPDEFDEVLDTRLRQMSDEFIAALDKDVDTGEVLRAVRMRASRSANPEREHEHDCDD